MRVLASPFAVLAALAWIGAAQASDDRDAEVNAWSTAFAAWVDVSRNIACPSLKPRIDRLTKRLGDIQDVFVARHPDHVFPPMIFASRPFIDCDDGAPLITRAETLAGQVETMVKR